MVLVHFRQFAQRFLRIHCVLGRRGGAILRTATEVTQSASERLERLKSEGARVVARRAEMAAAYAARMEAMEAEAVGPEDAGPGAAKIEETAAEAAAAKIEAKDGFVQSTYAATCAAEHSTGAFQENAST